MAAASTVHINLFGPHPIVVFGSDEQRKRWLRGWSRARTKSPSASPNRTPASTRQPSRPSPRRCGGYRVNGQKVWTSTARSPRRSCCSRAPPVGRLQASDRGITIFYTDLDRSRIEVRRIRRWAQGRRLECDLHRQPVHPESDRVGEEGKGFSYILHSLNPERLLVAAEAIAIGQDALRRATLYAKDRVVFGRPIGQNQSIQHPLAERWMALEAAWR